MFRFDQSSWWTFEVSSNVQPSSLGKRTGRKKRRSNLVATASATASSTSSLNKEPWTSKDFHVRGRIGSGHFGEIYLATSSKFLNDPQVDDRDGRSTAILSARSSSFSSSSSSSSPSSSPSSPPTQTCTMTMSTSKLFSGGYGSQREKVQKKVVLKKFSKDKILHASGKGSRIFELLQREINIHSHLDHPNIISFFGYYDDSSHLSLVLEYAPRGDLLRHMTRFQDEDTERRMDRSKNYLRQVVSAVGYLQSLQVAHRDIKPENIVVVTTRSGDNGRDDCLKLCDFGWSVWYQKGGSRQTTICGTPEYVPPEMLKLCGRGSGCDYYRGGHVSYEAEYVDLWALGVLAFELVYGYTPFCPTTTATEEGQFKTNKNDGAGVGGSQQIFNKIRDFRGFRIPEAYTVGNDSFGSERHLDKYRRHGPDNFKSIKREYADLVSRWMRVEPNDRLTTWDALDHNFLRFEMNASSSPESVLAPSPSNPFWSELYKPTVAQRCQIFQNAWSQAIHY